MNIASIELAPALILPFVGTVAGAACVFLIRDRIPERLHKALTGFAAGVMVAASVWSLLIPSMEMTGRDGIMSVLPDVVGFALGMAFLLLLDVIVPHEHIEDGMNEGPRNHLSKTSKLVLAVTLHNVPEGMAVGVALAAALEQNAYLSMAGALALSVGMAIQNFPEGAIVSMPLRAAGNKRAKAFGLGALSGFVEPVAALLTVILASYIMPILPYLLSFAAGAMMFVVVEELIPDTQQGQHSNFGTIGFTVGFILMMVLDVVLG